MFSIYTSAFNVIENNFDYKDALSNFAQFATEVVVAVNTSKDNSLECIRKHIVEVIAQETAKGRTFFMKVLPTDFSYEDPDLDGKVKNAALQATTRQYKIGLDLDERIPASNKPSWIKCARLLEFHTSVQAIMICSVNLYKDCDHCREIGSKWYLHKSGLYRGVVNFARNPDGTHDITKSDSCELINKQGNLVDSIVAVPPPNSMEERLELIRKEGYPYVLHYGYVDLNRRVVLNQNFWKKHWSIEAGRDVDIATSLRELDCFPCYKHNLPLC